MDESHRLIQWLVVGLLFLCSCYFSCQEVKYTLWGTTTDADITDIRQAFEYAKHGRYEVREVYYQFRDEQGTSRKGTFRKPLDWQPPTDRRLSIEFQPGSWWNTRVAGEHNYPALIALVVMIIAAIVITVRTVRDAYDY